MRGEVQSDALGDGLLATAPQSGPGGPVEKRPRLPLRTRVFDVWQDLPLVVLAANPIPAEHRTRGSSPRQASNDRTAVQCATVPERPVPRRPAMTVPSAGSPSDSTRRELEVPEPVALERVRGVPEEEVPERAAWASVGWSDAGGTGGAAVGGTGGRCCPWSSRCWCERLARVLAAKMSVAGSLPSPGLTGRVLRWRFYQSRIWLSVISECGRVIGAFPPRLPLDSRTACNPVADLLRV